MKTVVFISLFLLAAIHSDHVIAKDRLAGTWQHADKPATIEFDMTKKVAKVGQHQLNPDASGLTVIKNIEVNEHGSTWKGLMFNGYEGRYDPVVISLEDDKTLLVFDATGQQILSLHRP